MIGGESLATQDTAEAHEASARLGEVFGERYRIESHIGQGVWGSVYQGRDLQRSRTVAIKVMHADISRPMILARMRAHTAFSRLGHKRLIPLRKASLKTDGWVVSEWQEGVTVQFMLNQFGRLSVRRTTKILTQLCQAVHPLHANGMAHGNLKPANAFLLPSENGDFLRLADPGASTDYINPATAVGAPRFCSPEQLDGYLLPFSDQFSIGVLGYHMLSGQLPFFGATPRLVRDAVARCHPPRLSTLNPDVPPILINTIERCMRLDPNQRFADIDELYDAFVGCLEQTPQTPSMHNYKGRLVVVRRSLASTETPAVGTSAELLAQISSTTSDQNLPDLAELEEALEGLCPVDEQLGAIPLGSSSQQIQPDSPRNGGLRDALRKVFTKS